MHTSAKHSRRKDKKRAKSHSSHHDIPSRSIYGAFTFRLECAACLISWIHILMTGNQFVSETHSVIVANPLGGPEKRTEQLCSSYVTTEPQTHETNCPKSFSGWLPLSSFHTEPILNKHTCTLIQSLTQRAIDPWCYYERKHPPTHTHTCARTHAHTHTNTHIV